MVFDTEEFSVVIHIPSPITVESCEIMQHHQEYCSPRTIKLQAVQFKHDPFSQHN